MATAVANPDPARPGCPTAGGPRWVTENRSGEQRQLFCVNSRIHLDEDALPRTNVGCFHHRLQVPIRDIGERTRPARVVQDDAQLGHIGDAILELDEHIGTVVDTETIARAEVLVDPHAHMKQGTARRLRTSP